MIILGVALIVIALVVVAFVVIGGSDGGADAVTVSAFGVNLTTTALVLFLFGAATLLVLLVGVWMVRWGVTRAARTRAEIQRLRRIEAEVEARQLAELSERPASPPPLVERSPVDRPVAEQPGHSDPVPVHHSPEPHHRPPGQGDDRPGDAPTTNETETTRPFERSPSGSTSAAAATTATTEDHESKHDNSRL